MKFLELILEVVCQEEILLCQSLFGEIVYKLGSYNIAKYKIRVW